MAQKTHIIYIPGFNEKYDPFRRWALRQWSFKNVTIEMADVDWPNGKFTEMLATIDKAIDRASGKKIVLLGESAGGSLTVHAYAKRKDDVYKVMTICGKNTRPETVGEKYYDYSPAFRDSMMLLNKSLESLPESKRSQFVSIHPLYDPLVSVRDTLLPGCKEVRLWLVGHTLVTLLALTVLSPIVVRAAKR